MIDIEKTWSNHDDLIAIEAAASAMYAQVGYDSAAWATNFPEAFSRHQANGLLWVATIHGKPVGFAVADLFGDSIHLEEIDVHPICQRKGVASALLNAVIAEARERLLRQLTLRTFTTTPWSMALYNKFEFNKLTVPPYYLTQHLLKEQAMGITVEDRCTLALGLLEEPMTKNCRASSRLP